jgi:hypothetical protein
MNKIFLFVFSFISLMSVAQNKGKLVLVIDISEAYKVNNNKVEFILSKNDTITNRVIYSSDYDDGWKIDSLESGKYQIKVTLNDDLVFYCPNLSVEEKKTSRYEFFIFNEKKKWIDTNIVEDFRGEISLSGLYGDNSSNQINQLMQNHLYSGEFAINENSPITKYYSIGVKFGAQYARTNFYNDTTRFNSEKIQSKYYSNMDLNIGFFNRFTFFNNKKINKDGLKFDIGISYHFPLFFKQILKVNDDTKLITRHIHTYTDFTAMVRLAYKYVGLQAEYSLANFLRKSYTEIPQLRVGIVFFIPVVN